MCGIYHVPHNGTICNKGNVVEVTPSSLFITVVETTVVNTQTQIEIAGWSMKYYNKISLCNFIRNLAIGGFQNLEYRPHPYFWLEL
mgnify:CR=1 FL=1